MKCEECEDNSAVVRCQECEESLCVECDDYLHRRGKRRQHTRSPLCEDCSRAATLHCDTCDQNICAQCNARHDNHQITPFLSSKKVAVLWDMQSCRPLRLEDLSLHVTTLRQALGEPNLLIRAYGEAIYKLAEEATINGIQICQSEGLKETEAMLLEVSVMATRGFTLVMLITAHASQLKPHLSQLQQSLPQLTILAATKLTNLKPIPISELPAPEYQIVFKKPTAVAHNSFSALSPSNKSSKQQVATDAIPLFHSFLKKTGQEAMHEVFIGYLTEMASEGDLMIEYSNAIKMFQQKARVSYDIAAQWLKSGERLELFMITQRQFGTLRTVSFVSLKLDTMSLEALLWILRSLKRDEMIPTERAIQSRMKEVFDYKPTPTQWSNLLDAAKKRERHSHSLSAPLPAPDFSFFRNSMASDSRRLPMFIITDVTDPVTGTETCVIYPEGEEWVPLDQHCKSGDVLGVKLLPEWAEFVRFLEAYFTGGKQDKRRAWKTDEESKAIPGGRYGFAQFLKVCGPTNLQQCSLGKLSYMVQLAINEDLLRYQRTLLVWTPLNKKKGTEDETSKKLRAVQRAIVDLLMECKVGISLAQLPLHLKRSLGFPFDLAELGYAKLKDLLQTIPEVTIELRGTNHPFAVYKEDSSKSPSPPDAEEIISIMQTILRDTRFGMPVAKAENLLAYRLGTTVDWRRFSSSNIIEFVTRWGNGTFDLVNVGDSMHIICTDSSPRSNLYSPGRGGINSMSTTSFHSQTSSATSEAYNSMFYLNQQPTQKIVSISNLPLDFSVSPTDISVNREGEERQRRFIERLLNEGSDELSSRLASPFAPHYRTDSVEYHSKHPSVEVSDWRHLDVVWERPGSHSKAVSADLNDSQQKTHTRGHNSWFDAIKVNPPPGF
mmetsp:Transcript_10999/g.21551  ORF Transcript_10999/g.21551 Transcript_10999/m.21551 type:complete len:891 (+) Transcript_10999:1558-4230(+)